MHGTYSTLPAASPWSPDRAAARVVISSRNLEACEEVAQAIVDDGGGALAIPCNISRLGDVENLIHRALEEWGQIDILVNNAAVNPHYGPLAEIDEETYDKSFDSNVKSSLWLARLAMPSMVEHGGGSVIIVSSVGGYQGSENLGVYDLTKAADFALARNLAVEWGGRNIRVNCIAPGLIKTDFSRVLWDNEDTHRRLLDYIPLGRMGGGRRGGRRGASARLGGGQLHHRAGPGDRWRRVDQGTGILMSRSAAFAKLQ